MVNENKSIVIFGLGHMGLPTAALFAKNGLKVVGVDINKENVEYINSGISPIMEPGLDELVKEAVSSGNLSATLDGEDAVKNAKIMIVIVPTPLNNQNNADLSAVISACRTIASAFKKDDLVIIESTVPPGTCDNIVTPLLEESGLVAGNDFYLACTPERALPNNTIYEITHNARVIGGINQKSADYASSLYKRITDGEIINVKNLITAEMVKLMENTYRDVNIALANEFAKICENLDINAIEAIQAANHHPRVNIHIPGPGVGGHCLSIDPYFIVEMARQKGLDAPLINNSRKINESMPEHVVHIIEKGLKEAGKTIKGSSIGILGVAYKGDVADARETPAQPLINYLNEEGASVFVHDPYVSPETIKSFKGMPVNLEDALECECVVLITDHSIYKELKPEMIKNGVLVCTRPLLDPESFISKGIIFKGVGIS
ncbi:MAG: nucleotide sugar dehydrogenase [Methanobacterium sp.]|nr:nucleotide sugar dehydrogenase [Methanobacterium sp.]